MAWIITHDYNAAIGSKPGTNENAKGISGPNGSEEWLKVKDTDIRRFRMFDGDRICYYEGFASRRPNETGFEPLEDFGAPNAGCSYIEYLENGKWEVL